MKRQYHPAQEEGYKAFWDGKQPTTNPYPSSDVRHKLWIESWEWAQTLKIGLTENMDGSPGRPLQPKKARR